MKNDAIQGVVFFVVTFGLFLGFYSGSEGIAGEPTLDLDSGIFYEMASDKVNDSAWQDKMAERHQHSEDALPEGLYGGGWLIGGLFLDALVFVAAGGLVAFLAGYLIKKSLEIQV